MQPGGGDGVIAEPAHWGLGGHAKGQFNYLTFPENSLFRGIVGSPGTDYSVNARVNLRFSQSSWEFAADYQLLARYGDTVALSRELSGLSVVPGSVPDDSRRVMNLTHTFNDSGEGVALQRLDRFYVAYHADDWVVRLGRQAVSWGNGLVYSAMDFFNPFDPAAIDKEYKTGDDMIYGQYLLRGGDDLQLVLVGRRDPDTGDVESDESTLAGKYHGFVAGFEYDALVSRHFGDTVIGFGGNHAVGGAIWRGDLTVTRTDNDFIPLLVTSMSWSWNWGSKNVSGLMEYFYNGFGIAGGEYSVAGLAAKPELTDRLVRGELFTLGRNYLVASTLIELNPLFLLTPAIFASLDDPSALLQLVGQFDLLQDLQLLTAVSIPVGAPGTEYGGVEAQLDGAYFSTGPSLFLQLAWYF